MKNVDCLPSMLLPLMLTYFYFVRRERQVVAPEMNSSKAG